MNQTSRQQRTPFLAAALCLLALVIALADFAWPSGASTPPQTDLTVSAAISLKDALDEVRHAYAPAHPNVSLAMNYGASGTLQLQIQQGAPVDVYISASPQQMDALEFKGLLTPGTRRDLLLNEIVLIVPKGSSGVSSFQDLTKASVQHIALGEPKAVPAGAYAQEVLKHFGIADQVNAKAVLAKDVRQVLTYVETGNADAGMVYATDALTSKDVRIVARAPAESHAPVIYPVAVIKGSKRPEGAKAFEQFLFEPQARAIFKKYGFGLESVAAARQHEDSTTMARR